MAQRLLAVCAVCTFLALGTAAAVRAQDPDPADQAVAFLTGKGYAVSEVNYATDGQGKPRPDAVYVLMEAVSGNLEHPDVPPQVVWGFMAVHQYYPRAQIVSSVLAYRQYWIFFQTETVDLDRFLDRALDGTAFWNGVRGRVRIYDRVKRAFTDEKTFTATTQTGKDQTTKDFRTVAANPVPTPIAGAQPGGALWLEPSTTYLPASPHASAVMMATLLDSGYAPLATKPVTFTYQVRGRDLQAAGARVTDTNGAARASVDGAPDFDSVLLRVSTESLNSQISIVVGPTSARMADRESAVKKGLGRQGYSGINVDYWSTTRATGETENSAYVELRIISQSFDRSVYSELSRALGTLRTIFPLANELYVALIFRMDGRDWQLLWNANVADWDQLVAGAKSETEFWRSLHYLGAYDENGNRLDDKNFIDKNFGAGTGAREARVTRSLESTLTAEEWGEQWRGSEFVITPGSYADGMSVAEWSGTATSFVIFQAPDFVNPVLAHRREDSAAELKKAVLGQGQYLFAVVAPGAPAAVQLDYVEHLPR